MSHIKSGVRILESIGDADDSTDRLDGKVGRKFDHAPRDKFEVMFNRLDQQVNRVSCHDAATACTRNC